MRDRLIVAGVWIFGMLALMFWVGYRAVNWLDLPLAIAFGVCLGLYYHYVAPADDREDSDG